MVCVPCYAIPILLFLWKMIEPFISIFWKPKEQIKAAEPSMEGESSKPLITAEGDASPSSTDSLSNTENKKTD